MVRVLNDMDKAHLMEIAEELFDEYFYEAIVRYDDSPWKTLQNSIDDWAYFHRKVIDKYGLDFFYGVTKVCVTIKDFGWVLKVGRVCTNCDEPVNYCEIEADNFRRAINNNVADAFAATYQIGVIGGVPIFAQELVTINEDENSNRMYDYMASFTPIDPDETDEQYNERISEMVDVDMQELDIIYAMLGEDRDDVVYFCETFEINDLHRGNWGINSEGRCVVLDYSGFN